MSEQFEKSIRTLELPRVLQLLSEQAVSAEGKARCLRIRPETEAEEALRLLDQTDAARSMIGLRGSPSFSGAGPGGPGRQPEHPGAFDHRGPADRGPAGQGVLFR